MKYSLYLTLFALVFSPSTALADTPFTSDFWSYWSDGTAEINSYESTQPRYGEVRSGTIVTVFVSEPFTLTTRVKADNGKHPSKDVATVLKLNLVEDFPTGVYDYNLMTSSFVSLEDRQNIAAGSPLKVSFSSQEWCGHSYSQLLPNQNTSMLSTHSYFDGEADSTSSLKFPDNWVSEDVLLHWARNMSKPFVKNGVQVSYPVVRSLKEARLNHQQLSSSTGIFKIAAETSEYKHGDSSTIVREKSVTRNDGLVYRFYVEEKFPHKIVAWTKNNGFSAKLVASTKMAYWKEISNKSMKRLRELGLNQRPKNTP